MRAVGQPLLHPEIVDQLGLVVDHLEEVEIVFGHAADRREQEKMAPMNSPGSTPSLDHLIDILCREAAGPEIEKAMLDFSSA